MGLWTEIYNAIGKKDWVRYIGNSRKCLLCNQIPPKTRDNNIQDYSFGQYTLAIIHTISNIFFEVDVLNTFILWDIIMLAALKNQSNAKNMDENQFKLHQNTQLCLNVEKNAI